MPWLSARQSRFGHANPDKFGGKEKLAEWDSATDFSKLPETKDSRSMEKKPRRLWLRGALKHPGALTEAAHEHGVSKLQEAEKESHSGNPRIRARGALGIRFIKHKI